MVVLVGKAGHQFDRPLRDVHPGLIATTEVLDGHAHQFPGLALGVGVVELHMFRSGEPGLVRGGYKFSVIAVGHLDQTGHDALVVHQDKFHRPGDDGQLGHQMVAGHGNALAHQHLVARATKAGHVDAHGSDRLGLFLDLRIIDRVQNHFRDNGRVAVDEDVDLIGFEHAQIEPDDYRAPW